MLKAVRHTSLKHTLVARKMKMTTKKRQCTELYMLARVGVCSSTKEMAASTAVSTMKSATKELVEHPSMTSTVWYQKAREVA